MTLQEVFDKVVTHLRTQGVQANAESGLCLYRAPGGTSCAAGCLIPDADYTADMEGATLSQIGFSGRADKVFEVIIKATDCHDGRLPRMIANLQAVHDNGGTWRYADVGLSTFGESELRRVADQFKLVYTAPTNQQEN